MRFALRAVIIVGLVVAGWTPAAMAMPRVSDCALMMQTSPATNDGGDMDTRAPCPFAAYCAVASVYVAPDAAPAAFVVYRSAQVLFGIDDVTPAEFHPSPPARPPRS